MQVLPIQKVHTQLSDVAFLDRMHLDRGAQQYRDWGNHTEAVDMQARSSTKFHAMLSFPAIVGTSFDAPFDGAGEPNKS